MARATAPVEELRVLLRQLEARSEPKSKRLPKAASRFIRHKIERLHAEGFPIKRAVATAYRQAREKGLLCRWTRW